MGNLTPSAAVGVAVATVVSALVVQGAVTGFIDASDIESGSDLSYHCKLIWKEDPQKERGGMVQFYATCVPIALIGVVPLAIGANIGFAMRCGVNMILNLNKEPSTDSQNSESNGALNSNQLNDNGLPSDTQV